MTAPLTPIYDELVLEKLDTFDPVKCEIMRICDNRCCRIECTCDAHWVGHWRARAKTGITLACTGCKDEIGPLLSPDIHYEWMPL